MALFRDVIGESLADFMPLQLIFLRNVSLLREGVYMWETVHSARAVCNFPEIAGERGACVEA